MRRVRQDKGQERKLAVIYSDTPERRVFDLSRSGLPEVPALGFSRYGHVIAPVAAHRHAACLEIGLCLRGALTLLNKGVEHSIMPGDLYLNKSADTHCLTAHPKGTMIYWLLIRAPRNNQPFLRLAPAEARDLWTRLTRLPCHMVAKTDAVKQAFAHLFKYYEQPAGPYRTVGLNTACVSLLMGVVDASSHKATITHSRLIDNVIESLREKPERKASIDSLAREAGMSPSLFISQFKQLTGLPPYHFQLACRLEKAKRLLASTDASITQLAFDLGFCASQHFSSHFKRAFGVTPHAWKKQARPSARKP
ncbi:MAG: AraC family transcriptional regulator [Kiritimatiellae bacterium]|nr:AraC family transcriptional regulator [Kiritimatiellia bacterium]